MLNWLLFITAMAQPSDTVQKKNCLDYLQEMILSTDVCKKEIADAQKIGECNINGWAYVGRPDTAGLIDVQYSPTYDLAPWCLRSYDEITVIEWFSFDPKTNKLYLSKEGAPLGNGGHKAILLEELKFDPAPFYRYLGCISERSQIAEHPKKTDLGPATNR